MSEKPLIEIRGMRKWFPIKEGMLSSVRSYVRAVDGVDLEINRGETLGVVGESGCGKTTLGRVLMGLIPITEGSVIYSGSDIREIPNKEIRRKMQIVFQDPGGSMNPRISVRSIVGEPLQVNGICEGVELTRKVEGLLESVGLKPEHMTRFPTSSLVANSRGLLLQGHSPSIQSSSFWTNPPAPSTSRSKPRFSTCLRRFRKSGD